MPALRHVFLIALLLISYSRRTAAQHSKITQNKPATTRKLVYTEPPEIKTLKIRSADIGRKDLMIRGPFRKSEVLKQLLPGRYYHFNWPLDRKISLVAWQCTNCTSRRYSRPEDDPGIFPAHKEYMTLARDTLQYKDDNGVLHIIFSFETHEGNSAEDMYMGRYECAYMGLAVFAQSDSGWVLEHYTTALGCFGQFQYIPSIHLIKFGPDNFGCYFKNEDQGAGGPYYSNLYVFGIVDDSFKLLLNVDRVERGNRKSSVWNMKIKTMPDSSTSSFQPFKITMKGDVQKSDFVGADYDTISNVPAELQKSLIDRDSLRFIIERRYTFKNGAYQMTGKKAAISTLRRRAANK